jgi:uncharacterized protein
LSESPISVERPFAEVIGHRGLVDVDVHARLDGIDRLADHLDPNWLEFIREHNWRGPSGAAQFYPGGARSSIDPAWDTDGARSAGADLATLQRDVLDEMGTEIAIVNCYTGIDILRHPGWTEAVVRALNDWLIAEWLEPEPRLRGTIVLPARDPAAAVREIERLGSHPSIVQVAMPARSDRLYGQKAWHPVFQALQEHNLVMAIHRGGHSEASSPTGWASWFVEESVAEQQVFAAQLTSLVTAGVFQLFPGLRVSLLDCGFTWLPVWWWRMDADWRGLRREIPWIKEPPSEIIRRHMRVAAVPGDLGPAEELSHSIDWLESDELLMFGTDYPHLHGDEFRDLLTNVEGDMRAKLLGDSARAWYDL